MKILLVLICLFFQNSFFSQKKDIIRQIGVDNRVVVCIDSLSFLDPIRGSYFYIDSASMLPYTGKIAVFYKKNHVDSIQVLNGYRNGVTFNYKKFTSDNLQLIGIEIFKQDKLTYAKKSFNKNSYSGFFNNDNVIHGYFKCKKGKIVLYITESINNKKTKTKVEFPNVFLFKKYFEKYSFYSVLELIDFFG